MSSDMNYQWEKSVINPNLTLGGYNDIPGATSATYDPPTNFTQSTTYRLKVTNSCGTVTGPGIFLFVKTDMVFSPPNSNETIACGGDPSPLSFTVQNADSYQWESAPRTTLVYTDIPGATSNTYNPPADLTQSTSFRLKATNKCGTAASPRIDVTVNNNIVFSSPSSNQRIACGGDPSPLSFTVQNAASYQWQSAPTATQVYGNIAGATSATYNPPAGLTQNTSYRLKATNSCGTLTSNRIDVLVNSEATFGTKSNDVTLSCSGGNPGVLSYSNIQNASSLQWQTRLVSGSQNSWQDIGGADTSSYSPGNLTESRQYRILARGTCTDGFSEPITINVPKLSISSPQNAQTFYFSNDKITLGYGYGSILNATSYQWQSSTSIDSNYANIDGATSPTYVPTTITQTTYYRLRVSGGCSQEATGTPITVNHVPAATEQIHYTFDNTLMDTGTSPNVASVFRDYTNSTNTSPSYVATPSSSGQGISLGAKQYIALNSNLRNLATNNSFEIAIDFRYASSRSDGQIPIFGMKNKGNSNPGIVLMARDADANNFNIVLQMSGGVFEGQQVNTTPLPKGQAVKLVFRTDFVKRTWSASINGTLTNLAIYVDDMNVNALRAGMFNQSAFLGWHEKYFQEVFFEKTGSMIVDDFKVNASGSSANISAMKASLQQMTNHVNGTATLSAAAQATHTNTILNNFSGNYTAAKTEIDAYLAAFDANRTALFSDRNATYDLVKDFTNEQKITYYLRQDIFDNEFVVGKMSTMAGTKFREADVFPGPVSSSAPRVSNAQVSINGTFVQDPGIFLVDIHRGVMRPTGYYAAPGELITVTVPQAMVNQNVEVMVGSHVRRAWNKRIKRFERISKSLKITSTTTQIANPFGGGIYIRIPWGASLGAQNITISGAIKSPYFRMVTGQAQNVNEWITDLNNNYVPWVDIESDRIMFTLPRSMVTATDITREMQKWNEAMALVNSMGGRPSASVRAEYVLVDCTFGQNRAGYPKRMETNAYNGLTYDVRWNPLKILEESYYRADTRTATMLHELGHDLFLPKVEGGYAEVFVQLVQVATFFTLNNDLDLSIKATEHEKFDRDLTAMHWMMTNEFRNNQGMVAITQRPYQSRGAGWYFDIITLYGWNGLRQMHQFLYDKRKAENRTDPSYHYDLAVPITDIYQATAERIGKNLLPLFHFWGNIPASSNIRTYTSSSSVTESCEVYNRLLYYRSLVPANQAEFGRWRDALLANGLWDANGDRAKLQTIFNNYDTGGYAAAITNQINTIINTYFPNGSSCNNFKTKWTVSGGNTSITIPTVSGLTYSYQVDWNGDGDYLDANESTLHTGNATHDFGSAGTYTINIKGTFPRIHFNNTGDKDKIVSIDQWGAIPWSSMENAFYGCTNLRVSDNAGIPNLGSVTNLTGMFRSSGISTTGRLSDWDVSKVRQFNNMFRDASSFNQTLENWDIGSATSMNDMFNGVTTISTANYDSTLIGWATQDEKETQIPNTITFHGGNSRYCRSNTLRTKLMNATGSSGHGWTITDGNSLNCQITVSPVVFLQGAYMNPRANEKYLMRDDLRVANLIPTTSPYSDNLTCNASVFTTTGAGAIVDWVWLELRDASNTSTVIASRSALLRRDGYIVDVDGTSPVSITLNASATYKLVIRHRNHVRVVSTNNHEISGLNRTIDLSVNANKVSGSNQALMQGKYAIYAGDVNGNSQIQNTDINALIQLLGRSGYDSADLDMNGQIQNSDINAILLINLGRGEQF